MRIQELKMADDQIATWLLSVSAQRSCHFKYVAIIIIIRQQECTPIYSGTLLPQIIDQER